jgi:hypothetical protein
VGACVLCGRDAFEQHHPTQRDVDPEVMVPLCPDHHPLMNDDWNVAGIRADLEPATRLHALQLGLARWAMFFGRLATRLEHPIGVELARTVAEWLAKWAQHLRQIIAELDSLVPTWKEAVTADRPDSAAHTTPDEEAHKND